VQAVDGASGMSVAIEDARGNYGAVIVGGANRKLRAERVAFPRECAAILIQNEIDEALNVYLARRAQATRIPVIWNAAPARALAPDLARMTDVLIVNRVEAADILGTSPEGLDPIVAAEALAEKGPTAVIVTLGADGAVLAEGGHVQRAAAFPVPQKSSHGAGDAFVGAFAAEWRRGASMEEALRFAQGAAALVVATPPEDRADVTQAAVRGFMAGRSQIR
jgi:ribokinase